MLACVGPCEPRSLLVRTDANTHTSDAFAFFFLFCVFVNCLQSLPCYRTWVFGPARPTDVVENLGPVSYLCVCCSCVLVVPACFLTQGDGLRRSPQREEDSHLLVRPHRQSMGPSRRILAYRRCTRSIVFQFLAGPARRERHGEQSFVRFVKFCEGQRRGLPSALRRKSAKLFFFCTGSIMLTLCRTCRPACVRGRRVSPIANSRGGFGGSWFNLRTSHLHSGGRTSPFGCLDCFCVVLQDGISSWFYFVLRGGFEWTMHG